jgi:hypothetical protein
VNAINRNLCGRLTTALITLLLPLYAVAGNLDSPGAPTASAAQMHTLEDIYNRIDTGATANKVTTFSEPSAGPGAGTQHTLDEIYTLAGERNRVMETGQTTCVDAPNSNSIDCTGTGQDGEYQAGMAYPSNRLIDNGDGTVTDTLTQLIWLQDTGCLALAGSYAQGLAGIATLQDGQCSLSDGSQAGDWRMASIRELLSITYFGDANVPLFALFPPDAPFVKSYPLPLGGVRSSTLIADGNGAYSLELGPQVSIILFSAGAGRFHMAVRTGQ